MTKDIEKEIDELYNFLEIDAGDEKENNRLFDVNWDKRTDFFEKRWDSSFFSTASRY